MRVSRWLVGLWPGLPQLWCQGSWQGLLLAFAFAALLNLAVVSTLLWTDLFGTTGQFVTWGAAVCLSLGAWPWSRRAWEISGPPPQRPAGDLFSAFQGQYLQGNWLQAEQLLLELLAEDPEDADTQFALCTLYRHTRRFDEARKALQQLLKMEGAAKWALEINDEQRRLTELRRTSEPDDERLAGSKGTSKVAWSKAA